MSIGHGIGRIVISLVSALVGIGIAGGPAAAGSTPSLGAVPAHARPSDVVHVTYLWPGCGGITAGEYVVNLYWDTTASQPLATANLTPSPYDGKSDCGAKLDATTPKDAQPGTHSLVAQVADLKGNVQGGSIAATPFTVDLPEGAPAQTAITAPVSAAPSATSLPGAVGSFGDAASPATFALAGLAGGLGIALVLVLLRCRGGQNTDVLPGDVANRLQRAMDRDQQFADTISNLLKEAEDSRDALTRNTK